MALGEAEDSVFVGVLELVAETEVDALDEAESVRLTSEQLARASNVQTSASNCRLCQLLLICEH